MEENQIAKSSSMESDIRILTSGGRTIPAHSSVLASASPVLEKLMSDRPERTVPIIGVPSDAVAAFVSFIYSRRCMGEEEMMERHGIQLLVLSHVYQVRELKRACEVGLAGKLTAENVVDVLQLARECDAPYLSIRCMKFISKDFKEVEKTEGWRFLQDHDPWFELHILQFLDEAEKSRKRRMRNRKYQRLYLQLNEAMECLEHIFTEGCTHVGPHDMEPDKKKGPCTSFSTCCRGLQLLIRHFVTCKKKVPGGCSHCKRMWQLFRLHSSLCDQPESCKVPLCRQFKEKMPDERKGEDGRWRLLVRKVESAKAISSLSKRKRVDELDIPTFIPN
ncbi:BTB/POZ and TAZ domain-containing protein 1-like protein [Cinnamomum micranthum f. kanehirae]|uniref:BTB/POZ and TAZ domain-containing protein 1-like protein n=1 Tax=Cinnamomum micranthum f. kanehirae TaxID=337451 RepID=A0A3S3RAM6_9MAGN|nr:BTB/POZ and TAZ domain-containing protein 1-like protein [Cinnamomum micranthum f. kanehirae]